MNKRVLMAMSGGVDSSVAAALLKKQGYDVIGITLKLWDRAESCTAGKTCCSIDDVADARSVAAKLDIPFYVLNFKDVFSDKVIRYFIDTYLDGATPNPCIACNRFIKFGELFHRADILEAEYIATGHYARTALDEASGRWLLQRGSDPTKDQTYVLYNLTQEQLRRTLFPLGGLHKSEVRVIAEELGFSTAHKPDSQEICFVEDNDYVGFIRSRVDCGGEGNFIDREGRVLGRHKGQLCYTIGQRKGLGISFGKPMFVTAKDAKHNTVTLGEESELFSDTVIAEDLNMIALSQIDGSIRADVKARYSMTAAPATLTQAGETVQVCFDTPQRALTPGQSIVFYDGDTVIGGGIIKG